MSNPFSIEKDGIVNIATGAWTCLNKAEEVGKKAADEFTETRVVGEEKDIFSPIKLLRLKTFSDIIKGVPSKEKSTSFALNATC